MHVVWFDEEPPLDVYSEGVTRTNATRGLVYLAFKQLFGVSAVVHRFLYQESPDRSVTTMTIDEALHYSAEDRERIVAAYPEHEREARASGTPALGSGRVFPVAEDRIVCDPFSIPPHYVQIIGIDFGWDHPFAAVRCAWDRDTDVFYVVGCYRQAQRRRRSMPPRSGPGASGSRSLGRMTAISMTRAQAISYRRSIARTAST